MSAPYSDADQQISSRIAMINEIATAMNHTLHADAVMRVVSEQAKWLLDFEHCSIYKHPEQQVITLVGRELSSDDLAEHSPIYAVVQTGQMHITAVNTGSLREFGSLLIIPLICDGEIMGTLNFGAHQPHSYSEADHRVGYLLALQVAAALRNAERFQHIEQSQHELQRYAAQLEARNHELDAYGYTIAHELKSPLTQIVGFSNLTLMEFGDTLPDEVREYLHTIETSALKMRDMIDSLLWLSQLQDAAADAVTVDINAAVDAAFTRFHDAIVTRRILLDLQLDMPPALGHAPWLEEVFANLIGNAIKYIGKTNDAPRIQITGKSDGQWVRYEVRDNGIGIPPEYQTRLFKMFTRLHVHEAKGHGLGLSIVHRIVTKLNGTVGLDSAPGVGSTFWFTLPAA